MCCQKGQCKGVCKTRGAQRSPDEDRTTPSLRGSEKMLSRSHNLLDKEDYTVKRGDEGFIFAKARTGSSWYIQGIPCILMLEKRK